MTLGPQLCCLTSLLWRVYLLTFGNRGTCPQELRADVPGGLLAPVLWPKPLGRAMLDGLQGF